jgi:serine/threonine-protein kinase
VVPAIEINPRLPGTLNEIIMACLNIDPARRPAGMFEIRDQWNAVAKPMGLAEVDLGGADDED